MLARFILLIWNFIKSLFGFKPNSNPLKKGYYESALKKENKINTDTSTETYTEDLTNIQNTEAKLKLESEMLKSGMETAFDKLKVYAKEFAVLPSQTLHSAIQKVQKAAVMLRINKGKGHNIQR